jgi:hypothetical protein
MRGRRVAAALVRIGEARPVRFEKVDDYPVDTGIGCYADADAAHAEEERDDAQGDRTAARLLAAGVDPADSEAWHREADRIPRATPDLLERLRAGGVDANRVADVCVDPVSGTNLVAFHSGVGDGIYDVVVGFDASDRAVAFVTDFGLIDRDEAAPPPSPADP